MQSLPLIMDYNQIAILKEGWLQKQSKYLQQYRKRWIVLEQNGCLYSYKKKQEYTHHTQGVDLNSFNPNDAVVIDSNHTFALHVDSTVYRFMAHDEKVRNEWVSIIKRYLSFHQDMECHTQKWKQIIYDRTLKRMEFEAATAFTLHTENCISLHECPCAKRIIFLLNFYQIWCSKQVGHSEWSGMSLESIIRHKFGAYNTIQLINDCHHILHHFRKNKTLSAFFFIDKCTKCHPNKLKCCIYLRNNRKRQKTKINHRKIYYEYSKVSHVILMQILDAFHSFILHTHDTNTEEKYDDDNTNQIITLLTQHQNDHSTRMNHKFTTHITEKTTNVNVFGHQSSYWRCDKSQSNYINPKFRSLKEEMLHNEIYCLASHEWNVVGKKAMKYRFGSLFCESLAANNIYIWNKRTQINRGDPISIAHIICVLLNTNYCHLSALFKQELHTETQPIAHFCRLLFETVYLFGNVMNRNEYYYHNIFSVPSLPLFDSFTLKFNSQISCSTSHSQLSHADARTLTLKLHSIHDGVMPYFNVCYFTNYLSEDEVLLFRASLNISELYYHQIVQMSSSTNEFFMRAFKLFIAMGDGCFFTHFAELMAISTQKTLFGMLSKDTSQSRCYFDLLFNHYINNKKEYWINESELDQLDQTLRDVFVAHLYSEKNSHLMIHKMQLFSWHMERIKIDKKGNTVTLSGPTLLYTLNSMQIAFDSLMMMDANNKNQCTLYFGVSSMPLHSYIVVSFYLYCAEEDFYAQIHDNKMCLDHGEDMVQRVGCKFTSLDHNTDHCDNKMMTCKIAIKISQIHQKSSQHKSIALW
eukprot:45442_1